MRVFLDANVLFSASNERSNIAEIIARLIEVGEAITSEVAHEEAVRNLTVKREAWLSAFRRLSERIRIVPSARFEIGVDLDDKDRPLLCAAILANCQYFATGDKRDFGHLYGKTIQGVEVVSLLRLAELLAGHD